MRILIALILALIPFNTFAGTGGGGVGPRPSMMFSVKNDWVRTVRAEPDSLTFLYKPFEDRVPSIKTVPIKDISDAYLAALSESMNSNQ